MRTATDVGWLHGIGFLIMGLVLIVYGIVLLRSGVLGTAVPLMFIALPIAPLLIAELINAVTAVEGATLVSGLLWIGIAALYPQAREVERA